MTFKHLVTKFERDTTIKLPCRADDLIIWMRGTLENSLPRMRDFWRLSTGDSVTMTNRFDDLPEWFELCTYEVENQAAVKMSEKIKDGHMPPFEPAEGTNIWRILPGDRIVWMGHSRPEYESENGILRIFDFRECVATLGKPGSEELLSYIGFGEIPIRFKDEVVKMCQTAIIAVAEIGMPRTIGFEWRLG